MASDTGTSSLTDALPFRSMLGFLGFAVSVLVVVGVARVIPGLKRVV